MKTIQKLLCGAGIATAAGILVMGIGVGILRTEANPQARDYQTQIYTATGDVTAIHASLISEDIDVRPADISSVEITYTDDVGKPLYTISEKNGTLQIRRKSAIINLPVFYSDYFSEELPATVSIRVPKDSVLSTDFSTTSGNLSIADLTVSKLNFDGTSGKATVQNMVVEGDLVTDTTSGDIYMKNVSVADNLLCNSTSGKVRMDMVRADKNIRVDKTSGDWNLFDVTALGVLSMESTSGSIDGTLVSAQSVLMDTTSGDVALSLLTVAEKIDVDGTSSNVRIGLTDSWETYRIRIDTTSGRSNLPNRYEGGGKKEIHIDTTSGDVLFEE
ncbi:MAG: DUF4097 domain-containing protein [Muribaculaceae bacterium]|nr:DUF4097 domain-containing protein [Roseburia sp.]MCM1431682.1 DUF4097 domain-containing protein [Muribaculaceae bacterium]MCM1491646.1 DUF4097 domain-containing protein [Muribaculaceae bacterium]